MLIKRLRTWLFIASVLVAVFGPIVVGYWNRVLDAQVQENGPIQLQSTSVMGVQSDLSQADCIPAVDRATYAMVDKVVVGQNTDIAVSLRMAELFTADQSVRQIPVGVDPQDLYEGDLNRRTEVLNYITNGQIYTPRDLVYAAYIFQHGGCSEHYRLANRLAQVAMEAGYSDARWIYAATLDRYLMSLGELQKYGTQYTWVNGEYTLYPVDPMITDAERAEYNVPPLSEAMSRNSAGGGTVRRQWLETWWLTLIGAGFAALSAIIGIVDVKKNAPLGQIALAIAIGLYLVSVIGHYIQVKELQQGITDLQGNMWGIINGLMIMVWIVCASVEIVRVVKTKSAQPSHRGQPGG